MAQYGSMKVGTISAEFLRKYLSDNNVQGNQEEKFHVTTIYDREMKNPPGDPILRLTATPLNFNLFGPNSDMLVLEITHSYLHYKFNERRRAGMNYDFDEYKPHITLCTNFSGDVKTLPPVNVKGIWLEDEKFEDLVE
jgi:hypothetical protein